MAATFTTLTPSHELKPARALRCYDSKGLIGMSPLAFRLKCALNPHPTKTPAALRVDLYLMIKRIGRYIRQFKPNGLTLVLVAA